MVWQVAIGTGSAGFAKSFRETTKFAGRIYVRLPALCAADRLTSNLCGAQVDPSKDLYSHFKFTRKQTWIGCGNLCAALCIAVRE